MRDHITIYELYNLNDLLLAQFRELDRALLVLEKMKSETMYVMERTLFFADNDEITETDEPVDILSDIEGDWWQWRDGAIVCHNDDGESIEG